MKKILSVILAVLPYCLVFIASLYPPTDPDLGWHLKYGQYFFIHHTVLRTNTFSSLMPAYHWANVSWAIDVITYAIFSNFGFFGLSVASSLIVTLTFFAFSKAASLSLWEETFLFPVLLYLERPVNDVSFRGQQVTLLFLGILYYLFSIYKKKPTLLYFAIPLFFLWVNISGEFLLGTGVFFLWMFIYWLQKIWQSTSNSNQKTLIKRVSYGIGIVYHHDKKEFFQMITIFILSNLVTFINPFTYGVHLDAFSHIYNPVLSDIAEYLPFPTLSQPWWNEVVVGIFLCIGFLFLFFSDTIETIVPMMGIMAVMFIFSFAVRRFAWPAYYFLLPMLSPLPRYLRPDTKKYTIVFSTIALVLMLGITVWFKNPYAQYVTFNWTAYCQNSNNDCSPASAQYLIDHHLTQDVFSLYGWGGWLIWNYPQIKPVIDGRMDTWVDSNGYSGFAFYYALEQNNANIDTTNYRVVYMSPNKPLYNQMTGLVREGKWRLVYKDQYAGIFVKNT